MARLFAKYRIVAATIRVESAIPTSSGGQYSAFFDPNPSNNWVFADAVGALTSMPVQDTAAAWECLKLVIPPSELERNFELYTQEKTPEALVTRFGQFVLMNMAVPNVTPPGSAEVTVWLDATWEFYEPNVTSSKDANAYVFPAGTWSIAAGGLIQTPSSTPNLIPGVYRLIPSLPATFTAAIAPITIMAVGSDFRKFLFIDETEAFQYYNTGGGTKLGPGTVPSAGLLEKVAIYVPVPAMAVTYPYKRYP